MEIGTVKIGGHIYENVQLGFVRDVNDFDMFENLSFVASCCVNGVNWVVKRSNPKEPYVQDHLVSTVPPQAPLFVRSIRYCTCCSFPKVEKRDALYEVQKTLMNAYQWFDEHGEFYTPTGGEDGQKEAIRRTLATFGQAFVDELQEESGNK